MCGIAGYTRWKQSPRALEGMDVLRSMVDTLAPRGPDAEGVRISGSVAMGHRRLSVIDLSGGAQPMHHAELGLTVVFNGEIYNYRELNAELSALGYHAKSRSDTETVLLAYAAWGKKCVEKFNGMFAFVIQDCRHRTLFAARDRMGKKPLYYYHHDGLFAFASEPKALLQHPFVKSEIDPQAAARYFLHEYVPAPYAIFKDMRKLAGGQSLTYSRITDKVAVETYWDMPFVDQDAPDESVSEAEWGERIYNSLEAAVKRRLVSDVPLGVFLSGGIDSSAVTAAMVKLMGPDNVKTFTIGFDDQRFDESSHARRMARFLGTHHHEEYLSAEMAMNILPKVNSFLDEPFADPSVLPTFLLARFARQHVTVALAGDGGDELFAGYDTFRALGFLRFYNAVVPGAVHRRIVRPLASKLPVTYGNFSFDFRIKQFLRGAKVAEQHRLWSWLGSFVPGELPGLIHPDAMSEIQPGQLYSEVEDLFSRVSRFDPVTRDGYIFAKTYLADGVLTKVDRATMACGLEARSPMLDPEFVALSGQVPSRLKHRKGLTKYILRKAFSGVLPDDIIRRPKKGFGIPVGDWFRGKLRDELQDTLHERNLSESGLLKPAAVQTLIDDHLSGRRDNRKPLWTLFMFERWRKQWLKSSAAPRPETPIEITTPATNGVLKNAVLTVRS
ncbi:MAG TPA: asparagine synthase (glutamine-hydrolyzing) [Planctomycetota bacterium]|nr:asparagine synthase (glutamine-hydrolyzing) [Planctomycetota bacterium]